MSRPTIQSPCVADRYATPSERIAEIHSTEAQAGALVSARVVGGMLIIEVYSADPNVRVIAPSRLRKKVGGRGKKEGVRQ